MLYTFRGAVVYTGVVTIEADSKEEAIECYNMGEFDDVETYDFSHFEWDEEEIDEEE